MGGNGASLAGWLVSGACGGSGRVVMGGGRVVVVVLVVEVVVVVVVEVLVVLELVEEVDDVSLDFGGRVLVGVGASVVVESGNASSVVVGLKEVVV